MVYDSLRLPSREPRLYTIKPCMWQRFHRTCTDVETIAEQTNNFLITLQCLQCNCVKHRLMIWEELAVPGHFSCYPLREFPLMEDQSQMLRWLLSSLSSYLDVLVNKQSLLSSSTIAQKMCTSGGQTNITETSKTQIAIGTRYVFYLARTTEG